ncbi:MAG: hypothetical protein HKN20_01680 [Gemmatimonadetes bacterium]|nr:hypothetical protein [Gemmatimonadota bacterium]
MRRRSGEAPRFLVDGMLARLARWLRAAGFDAQYADGTEPRAQAAQAMREGRIVVTRNRRFPKGPGARQIVLESKTLERQMVELLRHFPHLNPLASPFSRCTGCNEPVAPSEPPNPAPPGIEGPFTRCPRCGRYYWRGSHYDRMHAKLVHVARALEESREREAAGEPPPIKREDFDEFLREALILLGLSWRGYRRVRWGFRTRLRNRLRELGLLRLHDYMLLVRSDPSERERLGALLAVTISRFFRDRGFWFRFADDLFPALERVASGGPVRVWSLGCASGEEPYTLRIMWRESGRAEEDLSVLATDLRTVCLERARRRLYPESAVHNVPAELRSRYLHERRGTFLLDEEIARGVQFERFDWRSETGWPVGDFHWVLARNGIFTYDDESGALAKLERIEDALVPGGYLWIGGNERLPDAARARWTKVAPSLYRK